MADIETRRVVLNDGTIRAVEVDWNGLGWVASFETLRGAEKDTPRLAMLALAHRHRWEVAEIRCIGEKTTAEQVAAAVEAERERCIGIARKAEEKADADRRAATDYFAGGCAEGRVEAASLIGRRIARGASSG